MTRLPPGAYLSSDVDQIGEEQTISHDEFTRVARALADGNRLAILRLLARGRADSFPSPEEACCPDGVCVCDLMAELGMIQSRISYHLKELKSAGLVSETRVGKWNYYTLKSDRLRAFAQATLALPEPGAAGDQISARS